MQSETNHNKIFLSYQHKFRGLVADFKAKKFEKNKRFDHSFLFRSGYRALMLEVRSTLHPPMFSQYLQWCAFHIKHQLPELSRYPTGYDELEGISHNAPITSIEREILWIAARINEDKPAINLFRIYARKVELLILSDNFAQSIELLKELEALQGASFWSIQLRIALEGMVGGLEGQKKYTAEVRSIYKSGLLNFIAYNTSVRNEGRVSMQKFAEDMRQRISDHSRYDSSVKNYMRHRMLSEWPNSDAEISDVLRVEQSHSLTDVYETFLSLLQHSLCADTSSSLKSLMKHALQQISGINDYRLSKCRLALGLPLETEPPQERNNQISENLYKGNIFTSIKEARKAILCPINRSDAWTHIYLGVSLSLGKCHIKNATLRNIWILISKILKQDKNSSNAYASILKITANFSGLPFSTAIRSFAQLVYRKHPYDPWQPELISINTPLLGAEDSIASHHPETTSTQCWAALNSPKENLFEKSHNVTATVFLACGLIAKNQHAKAIELLKRTRSDHPEAVPALQIQLLLNAYYALGMRKEVIELIADEGARHESRAELIPIVKSLENYPPEEYNHVTGLLTAPVALHLLWNKSEREITGSQLRFKASQVIRKKDIQKPAKLYDLRHELPRHVLIYFLKEICIPNLIDQARIVKTTAEILAQRQETCSILRELDPERTSEYEDEILEITNRQIMSAGQWIVDRTRIHVDSAALTRWATRELSEDYYRYKDLAAVTTPIELDEIMREILSENHIPIQFSDFDEADTILYSMLTKIGSEFLNNSLFGLDYYLSKRIRHQSFVGLIRSPLELKNIITTKDSGGSGYNKNEMWLNKFNDCNKETINLLTRAFNKFSASFDNAIIETKDKIIQIKSKDHPQGLIFFEINPQIVPLTRMVFRDSDISTFIKASIELMWAFLNPSLGKVRKYISEELKPNLTIVFDEFKAEIKSIVEGRPGYYELNRVIGESSVQVQLALDDASSWFSKINDEETFKKTFNSNQAVAISIEATKKCLRSFEPTIEITHISKEVDVFPSTLVFLHDVLFVSIDNARVHSGLKKPTISIEIDPDLENERLVIRTQCQAKQSARADAEKKLSEIREKIERGEYDTKTKTEGGSGLYKIAAVVKQSAKGAITFGFNKSGDFEISVTYNFLNQSKIIEEPA